MNTFGAPLGSHRHEGSWPSKMPLAGLGHVRPEDRCSVHFAVFGSVVWLDPKSESQKWVSLTRENMNKTGGLWGVWSSRSASPRTHLPMTSFSLEVPVLSLFMDKKFFTVW